MQTLEELTIQENRTPEGGLERSYVTTSGLKVPAVAIGMPIIIWAFSEDITLEIKRHIEVLAQYDHQHPGKADRQIPAEANAYIRGERSRSGSTRVGAADLVPIQFYIADLPKSE